MLDGNRANNIAINRASRSVDWILTFHRAGLFSCILEKNLEQILLESNSQSNRAKTGAEMLWMDNRLVRST